MITLILPYAVEVWDNNIPKSIAWTYGMYITIHPHPMTNHGELFGGEKKLEKLGYVEMNTNIAHLISHIGDFHYAYTMEKKVYEK